MVQRMSREGYHILVLGDPGHAEIKGVVSFAEGPVTVVAPGDPVPDLPGVKRVGVVCQTTLQGEHFQHFVSECVLRFKEVRTYNTICYDTDERADRRPGARFQRRCGPGGRWPGERQYPTPGGDLARNCSRGRTTSRRRRRSTPGGSTAWRPWESPAGAFYPRLGDRPTS